ncbi:MAG: amino acid ABC transporter permease [Succinivibrio sp.]|nr:amino acid ABC transporter permease [Succinivibrio sp.]
MQKIFDPAFMLSNVPEILSYLPVTLGIAAISGACALIIGLGVALLRFYKVRILSQLCALYVSFIRGTPCLVQLLIAYYGIPVFLRFINAELGTSFNVNGIHASVFAIIALGLNSGAFMSETLRSAIQAVDRGQFEACYSLNMSPWQTLRRIVLPQAFVTALPPLGNSFISLLKETSLVFSISVVEMMAAAKIVGSRSFRFFEMYIVVAFIYWICCLILEQIFRYIEKRGLRTQRRES